MSDSSKVVDFSERAKTKLEDNLLLQLAIEDAMAAQSILVDAIERTREMVDDLTVSDFCEMPLKFLKAPPELRCGRLIAKPR